jgi:hypothetical protein
LLQREEGGGRGNHPATAARARRLLLLRRRRARRSRRRLPLQQLMHRKEQPSPKGEGGGRCCAGAAVHTRTACDAAPPPCLNVVLLAWPTLYWPGPSCCRFWCRRRLRRCNRKRENLQPLALRWARKSSFLCLPKFSPTSRSFHQLPWLLALLHRPPRLSS